MTPVDKLAKRMFEFQKECLLCDVMLHADDGIVEAHSLVLAAVSPLMCGLIVPLFDQFPVTRSQYSVDLSGFSSSHIRMALCFLYTGHVSDDGIATNEPVESYQRIQKICNILGVDLPMFGSSDAEEHKVTGERVKCETFVVIESHDAFSSSRDSGDKELIRNKNCAAEKEPARGNTLSHLEKNCGTSMKSVDGLIKSLTRPVNNRHGDPIPVRRVKNVQCSAARRRRGNQSKGSGKLACSMCSKVFHSRVRFSRHFVIKHQNLVEQSTKKQVQRKPPQSGGSNMASNHLGELHRVSNACETCGKSYRSLRGLELHRLAHDGIKPFLCDTCGQGFQAQSTLDRHNMLRHSDRRPFVCDRCGKGFVARSRLVRHEETHDPLTRVQYSCETCGAQFANPGNLLRHRRLHSVMPRPYSCDTCGKTFTQKTSLTAHLALHDPEARRLVSRQCPICSKTLSKGSNLSRHVQQHHRQKIIECSYLSSRRAEQS